MRTPQVKTPSAGASSQKRQLTILAALAVVLVAVVALQFGQDSAPVALASTADDGAVGAVVAPQAAGASAAANPVELSNNLALSGSSVSGDGPNPGAFESFWSFSEPVDAGVEELPPPTILLSATLIGREGELDVAVIDGNLRYVGDMLQGWSIDSITSRAVTLRSSSNRVVTVAMPLFRPTPPPESPVAGP